MKANKNLMGGFGNQIDLLNTMGGGLSMTSVNLEETSYAYVVKVKTPSLQGEAYHIEVNGNQLIIYTILSKQTELSAEQEEGSQKVLIPSFIRSFPLPPLVVDKNRIEAVFEEGELKVIVPKNPQVEEKPRKIEIRYN
jgi:HSP20 family protein